MSASPQKKLGTRSKVAHRKNWLRYVSQLLGFLLLRPNERFGAHLARAKAAAGWDRLERPVLSLHGERLRGGLPRGHETGGGWVERGVSLNLIPGPAARCLAERLIILFPHF